MDKLSLKNQLCFKLYALSRHITSLYRPILEELDLTYPQYLVLLVLWEKNRISVKELGHHLMLDSGTLTPLLKRMESKDLIHRQRSMLDERVVEVSLKEGGTALKQKALCIPEHFTQSVTIDAQELKQFAATLSRLMDQIPE
ncbi:MarR family winged helix-turn-helix transcriptional regulator [Anditalea andensis]|uniref:HTH-type transcriptional regulator SarZ n=1 Tax=Anditalea andensis TaxID=1048983 RepID=A0A074L0T4_9BACT|nr:MarR family transcriptional regulator [Anditalea andensis]KEO74070.1 MarR family transcriptional regulator [Anditalea andensis]